MRFSEIPGQTDVKRRLIQTVLDNRVSHAQLFYGPEGSGKLALAIAYAQYISCGNRLLPDEAAGLDGDSCGHCPSCIKYQKLTHPDLHFFFPTVSKKEEKKTISRDYLPEWRSFLIENEYFVSIDEWYRHIRIENKQGIINAEDCQEMVRALIQKPYESEYKVLIIWMVEKLYYAAAPKILKALEEPPPKTLFLIVCENHDQVLNTIISRTQLVKVHRFDDIALMRFLEERRQAEETTIRRILPLANGNIMNALSLLKRTEEEEQNYKRFRQLLQFCYQRNIPEMVSLSETIAGSGREQIKSFLAYGLMVIRYTLLNNAANKSLIRLEGEELQFIEKLSGVIKTSQVPAFNEQLNKAIFHIERNGAPRIVLIDMSLTFADIFSGYRQNA